MYDEENPTLSDFVTSCVIRCVHSLQIWDEIHKYIFSHTNSKLRHLRSQSKSTTKGEKSINEYFFRVQHIVNILDSIDDSISHYD